MDPTSPSQQPSSGPTRRTRSSRPSLNIPLSTSSGATAGNDSTTISTPKKASAVAVRGSPYARPTPSPAQATSSATGEPKSSSTPGILSSLFRGALGSIGWASSPSKKAAAPAATDDSKDESVAHDEAMTGQEKEAPSATKDAAPTPRRSSRAPSATRQLTSSRSLSHLGPQREGSLARDRRSVAPSPARGNPNGAAGPPPSAWPGPTGVAAGTRSRSRGLSRDPSPALTNVSAHVAARRGVGASSQGLYASQQQRPLSMMHLSSTAMSDFGAGGPSPRRTSGNLPSSSFHVPNVSPFAAPQIYRSGSVAGSSRGGTPVRRAGSMIPGGAGYMPSPLGGGRPSSRAGSVADSAISGFTAGGTPRRGRNSLNLSGAAVRRAPSVLGLASGSAFGGRSRAARLSEGEAMLESYMHSREGELDMERMSQTGGSRAGTPAAAGVGPRASSVLGAQHTTPGGLHLGVGSRGRSVAPSPSPLRAAFGLGRQYPPVRNASPVVGQKRRAESVTGGASEQMSNMSIEYDEPLRKRQMVYSAEKGQFITAEAMQALKPRRSRNTADMILNEIEGVRTPLGDAQTMARRAIRSGAHLSANVAIPEPRANLSAAKAATFQMLPPKLPGSAGAASGLKSLVAKPIGPRARRQAFLEKIQKGKANAQNLTEDEPTSLRERVQQIRARDGTAKDKDQDEAMGVDEEDEEQRAASDEEMSTEASPEKEASPEPEPIPKHTRKSSRRTTDTESTPAEAESSGSRRTLRTRKDKAEDTEPPSAAPATSKEYTSSSGPAAEEPPKSTVKEVAPQKPATEPLAAPAKAKAPKPDTFQVLSGDAPRSTTSSLRQRTEKKHRKHESVGRFGMDDDDEEEDDGVTAEELAKITAPRILFPAGFKFGGDASAKPAASATPAAPSAKTTETSGTSTSAPISSAAMPVLAPSAPAAPSVSLPALLPPPKDAVPVTSLFDRIGEKAPAAPAADASKSPRKTVTFATPISETTTFQKDSSTSTTSSSSSSAAAPAPASSGFQFKAPGSTDSLLKPPSAGTPATSNFFAPPAAKEASKPSEGGSASSSASNGAVPNFFSSSLQKRDADKPEAASSPAPVASSGSGAPSFFASSLNKSAAPASTPSATTSSAAPSSAPNFFASSLSKDTNTASTSTPAASAPVASTNALKSFTGFGAPAATTSTSTSASTEAAAKPAFTGFGVSAVSKPASDGAPKPATFSFGASSTAASTPATSAPASTPSIFGGAAPQASKPLFGSPASTKRSADEPGSGDSAEPITKKPFGGFGFGAPAAAPAATSAQSPATAAPASIFGNPAATSSTGSAPAPFSFIKPASTTLTGTGAPASSTTGFSFGGAATNTAAASSTNASNGSGMDTSGSPPKSSGFGFSFGGNNATPSATGAPTSSTSMFGQPTAGQQQNASVSTPSFGFGQPQSGASAPASNIFGSNKPATATNMFGQSAATTNNTGATGNNPFGGFNSVGNAPSTPTANGFGSGGGSGLTLNAKPNFNFGAAPSQGAGGMFAFGSGSNTPTQSTTPTVAPATPPVFGGFGASNASAPSAGGANPFMFGGAGGGQAAGAQSGAAAAGGGTAAFQFGGGAGAVSTPTSTPASPFMFGASAPGAGAGGGGMSAPGAAPSGGPMFSLGAAPTGGGAAAGPTGPGGRPMRPMPRRKPK
ncbi:hypothetical protein OC846_001793 [Tilletia horrida]|uniref:Uncharacterized protein n=1 Tax=Tilletia horrida TaxID=155126 RepID=A0AAN6JT79_9BASI|nr:hypothetical protein OC846_001793 [Tilletia horrida]